MRNEPPREVLNIRLKTRERIEPRGGSAKNGGERLNESDSHVAPNGEIGVEGLLEGDTPADPDLANLKDNGADCPHESEKAFGLNGEIGIALGGE